MTSTITEFKLDRWNNEHWSIGRMRARLARTLWQYLIDNNHISKREAIIQAEISEWYLGHPAHEALQKMCINGCTKLRSGSSKFCSRKCRNNFWEWVEYQRTCEKSTDHLNRKMYNFYLCQMSKPKRTREHRKTMSIYRQL